MTGKTPGERAGWIVNAFLDDRLKDADEPPGLREAVINRVAVQVDDIAERCGQQMGNLGSSARQRIPDAYLADEEVAENELQAAAAGIRTARALEGGLSDPRTFERRLAHRLASSARWALRNEASRVPRPATRASALDWSLTPIPWAENETAWPPPGALALGGVRQLTGEHGEPPRVAEKPYAGWVQLAMFERQRTLATRHPAIPARQVVIATGIEACDGPPSASSMPLSAGPPNAWAVTYDRLAAGLDTGRARTSPETIQGPLAALIDYEFQPGAPAPDRGTGLLPFAFVPGPEIIAILALRPEAPAVRHVLIDGKGPALAGRLWHGFLIHDGNYSPLEPAVHGADLLIRPDLYEILESAIGRDRLSLGIAVMHSEPRPSPGEPDNRD